MGKSPIANHLSLVTVLFLALAGCQQTEWRGNAMVPVFVACPDFSRVAEATAAEMSARGYRQLAGTNEQVQSYAPVHPNAIGRRILAFVHGGQDAIWIVAQPKSDGWTLYAMVEPAGYDTYFPRHKIGVILEKVRQRCEKNAAVTTNAS